MKATRGNKSVVPFKNVGLRLGVGQRKSRTFCLGLGFLNWMMSSNRTASPGSAFGELVGHNPGYGQGLALSFIVVYCSALRSAGFLTSNGLINRRQSRTGTKYDHGGAISIRAVSASQVAA